MVQKKINRNLKLEAIFWTHEQTIMDELPVSLDQATIKRLCDKQEQQAILLHKEQHRYDQRLRTKNNKISSLKQRQVLLSMNPCFDIPTNKKT